RREDRRREARRGSAVGVRRGERAGPQSRRSGEAIAAARTPSRDRPVPERALVLLSGTDDGAGGSVVGMRDEVKRVLLLATTTGYQTRAFGEAAERMGVELVFATDRCDHLDDPWQDRAVPIRFHDEDRSVEAILESTASRPIDGVLAV